ncbi:GNAT family N-acetyltransferase [Janibacter terrae]|jgi:GNAT superfamily N-acetyltransferase|uniref:GNAT family N-acetyltransferase n=1 Tax=Janibacter terrae TaxID=103817 RepID=A0ABZ2FCL8_9MICO|nr:GNAT family N-acetyltransferase [Janibacter terrae]MBA4085120.1 GNAT family N-acetyltransferase [Kytococcus sp.]HBO55162.1 GNAT family N-acetyltransferase [Janibacter terrae]
MDTRIRPVERDDAFALAALRVQQDRERGHAPRDGFLLAYADAFLADFASYRGWIAEQGDGRPVGCVLALRVRKLPTLGLPGRPEWWYVQQVYVSADLRRRGVATRLVHAVQEAAAAERVRWVRLNASDAGRPFFDAMGFTAPRDRLREWLPSS